MYHVPYTIYATIEVGNREERRRAVEYLKSLGANPQEKSTKVEIRFTSDKKTVSQAVNYCMRQVAHSVNFWQGE